MWELIREILPERDCPEDNPYKGALIIDGNNMIQMARKDMSVTKLDPRLLASVMAIPGVKYDCKGKYCYVSSIPQDHNGSYREFLSDYSTAGFNMVTRIQTPIFNNSTVVGQKGNCDVEIALLAARMLYEYDVDFLILISGDRDFLEISKLYALYNKKVVTIATVESSTKELRKKAHLFVPFESIIDLVKML